MALFGEFNQVGVTVLIATHDLELIEEIDHPKMRLSAGRVVS